MGAPSLIVASSLLDGISVYVVTVFPPKFIFSPGDCIPTPLLALITIYARLLTYAENANEETLITLSGTVICVNMLPA